MKAKIAPALLLAAVSTIPAAAQQAPLSDRVAKAMPAAYEAPNCGLKSNHFKVSSGATYLKTAIETDIPENRSRILESGEKVLLEAITQNDQGKNPAAWYHLGRIYLHQGDLYGADSALTRAEQMAPACAKEIANHRRNGWVALIRAGSEFEEQKRPDSALALYHQATVIYRKSPVAFYQVAALMNDRGQPDSAAEYFGRAVTAAQGVTDTTEIKVRDRSAFNQGVLLLNAKKYDGAVKAFEQYLQWVPNDIEGKRGLASAYRGLGQADKAQPLEQQIVAAGGAAPAGGGAASPADDLMSIGVNLYNDKKYAEAAAAFDKAATAEPYNRDALSNLSNTYLALKDGAKLLPVAQRLAAIEPMNENAQKLVGEGYKQTNKVDDAVKTAEKVLALPVDVSITDFTTAAGSAEVTATATGRKAQTPTGKAIPAAPVTLVFEFLDAKGGVVASQEVPVPALEAGASHAIKAVGKGPGIAAWRYKKK
ncbi:MAG: tetratricopeptide repeat protein [Gemmatimonadales bacterium]|nr:tetratricopeptide repeat protein [Gemmatimonadales bacterium]